MKKALDKSKKTERERLLCLLEEEHLGYILITCSASEDSKSQLEVKMDYCGETALLSYLLEGAQAKLE